MYIRKMIKVLLVLVFLFSTLVATSQTSSSSFKEVRVSGGVGIAYPQVNPLSPGQYLWLQHAYRFAPKVWIATEYESMVYKRPTFYSYSPPEYDKIKFYDHNISLLFKYQVITTNKTKLVAASGWTYCIQQREQYEPIFADNGVFWSRRVTSFSEYKIPLLVELEYPLFKAVNIQARVKYNLVANDRSTYGAGIGASLKL